AALRDDTGKLIHIGLEPEPDCFLETTGETISFFENFLLRRGVEEVQRILGLYRDDAEAMVRRHLGVCFDTCHVALQFEDLTESLRAYKAAGILISKVQLSAALRANSDPESWEALRKFVEPVYLHQVKGRTAAGTRFAWYDLPPALEELSDFPEVKDLRVHFHVPLFAAPQGLIGSTADTLTPDFFHELRNGACPHVEIETYTFDVLPPEIHPGDIVKSISREYAWVLERLGAH
ncbi:MAG: xylose isomerase, partial [Chthoniobacteraceae bacterium]